MSNTHHLPPGFEILEPAFLRKRGTVPGMLWITTNCLKEHLGKWDPTGDNFEINEERLRDFTFAAPISAMRPTLLSDLEALAAEWEAESIRAKQFTYGRLYRTHAASLRALIQKHAK